MVNSSKLLKFNVIAAACENMGIGVNGDIPWRLKKEMAYFTRMTSTTEDSNKRNAVIMGRRTWDCIPLKYRPLPGRFNVVISNTINETGYDDVPVFKSLDKAVGALKEPPYSESIEAVWIIGGSSLYEEAINSPLCDKIYLTRVKGNFECDTFFPNIPSFYKEIQEENVPSGVQEENGISYVYTVLKQVSK